jgi:hypothetical protein
MRNLDRDRSLRLSIRLALVALAILGAMLAPTAEARQAGSSSQSNLADDIQFARDLARYRYFDLSIAWLDGLEKAGKADDENKTQLALARALIARLASQYATSNEDRRRYYDEAVTRYRDAIGNVQEIDAKKGSDLVEGLASVLVDKGKYWIEELDRLVAEERPEAELAEARKVADEAFKEAIKTLNSASDQLARAAESDGVSEADQNELIALAQYALYRKGEAYFNWALLYDAKEFSREDYLGKSIQAMEDYIWEAGNETILAMWAFYYQGMAHQALAGLKEDGAVAEDEKALTYLRSVYGEEGINLTEIAKLKLPENESVFVLEVVERARLGVAKLYREAATRLENAANVAADADLSTMARSYRVLGSEPNQVASPVTRGALVTALRQAAVATIEEFQSQFETLRLAYGPFGGRARLEKARAQIDLGQGGSAVELVKTVAEQNANNVVGVEAKALLSQLLAESDEASQPASVWDLVGSGAFSEGRWLDAIDAYHKCVQASKTDAERKQFALNAYAQIGRAYSQVQRNLECALAFEAGFELAQALKDEDAIPQFAVDAYSAWNRRFAETKQPFDEENRNRVRKIVNDLGASPDVAYFEAVELFTDAQAEREPAKRKQKFAAATATLAKVPEASSYYERALVYLGRGEAEMGEPGKALATFTRLADHVEKVSKTPSGDSRRVRNREIAAAQGAFYRASVLLDQKDFGNALTALEGFEEKFAKEEAFFPAVMGHRVTALIALKRIADAEPIVDALLADHASSPATTKALNELGSGYFELSKAADAEQKVDDANAALTKALEYLSKHNERTGFTSFINLRNSADWSARLGRAALAKEQTAEGLAWMKKAKENYSHLIEKFGKQPNHQRAIENEVMREYSDVLLALEEFDDALPILRKLYAANGQDMFVVKNFARCLGGWIEPAKGRNEFIERTGAGQHKEAMEIWGKLADGLGHADRKNTPEFWEARANFVFQILLASRQEPGLKANGIKLIQNWNSLTDMGGPPWKDIILRVEKDLQK